VIEHLRRNWRLVGLFVAIVLIPAMAFGVLIVRAMQSDRRDALRQRAERQQQIAQLVENDLNDWLFSIGPSSAGAHALARFRIAGDQVVFDDFQLALPIAGAARPRPLQSSDLGDVPSSDALRDFYYPRIVVFLRDIKARMQYFQRLHAVIVRLNDGTGYVIDTAAVSAHVDARLAQIASAANVHAAFSIADLRDNRPRAGETTLTLKEYPFFLIDFAAEPDAAPVTGHTFVYAMTLLVALTLLGSVFLYRAVSQELRLSRLRTDFVAAVSHEFRSPLSSILALSERLTSARVSEPAKLTEYHALIDSNARRLSSLVGRLLDFAQIEEGRKAYTPATVDLAAAARDAIRICREVEKAHPIEFDDAGAAPLWVNVDRLAVHQCLQNLVENAAKYSSPGSPIRVTCASRNGCCTIEVRDEGIGIPAAEQGRIFDKFYRGREAASMGVQGVGIGLALVKHMVESHHGSVDVESAPGRGSTFRLSFPRAKG
jgi:two-component system phosphate regulon sensor histidine kinase PhoR